MPDFTMRDVTETPYLYAERTCSMDPAVISQHMGSAFQQVWQFMQDNSIAPAGAPLSVYYHYSPDTLRFRSGFAVAGDDAAKAQGDVKADTLPAGRVLHFIHKGSYATLRDDYGEMMQYLSEKGLQVGTPTWEVYINDPAEVPEEDLLTEIYVSLAG